VAATNGGAELAKVNVDESPQIGAAFKVQSIPAVFALRDGKVVDSFIGAVPRAEVDAFVARLAPAPSEADLLVAAGDEASLRRALELEPDHAAGVAALARLLIGTGRPADALELLARVPEWPELRGLAAEARLAGSDIDPSAGDVDQLLDQLLDRAPDDGAARQQFIDLLETLGPDDPRTSRYRKALATRLF
jgi:putative thioredoxin